MNEKNNAPVDLTRLHGSHGREYWSSLEELADTPEFREYLHHEFPRLAALWDAPLDRRGFLKIMAAGMALAGVGGCNVRQPDEKIIPYVDMPEQVTPGEALYYATALTRNGFGLGVLVESHTGRPTRITGNARHPASLGAADVMAQAAVLELYDPDRSQALTVDNRISTWDRFLAALTGERAAWAQNGGAGLRILSGAQTSPTLAAQMQALRRRYPNAQWHYHEPIDRTALYAGNRLAFGRVLDTYYRLDKAQVILALDADFLDTGAGHLRYAHDFMQGRRLDSGAAGMNRLYAVESTPSITGAMADHRQPLQASAIAAVARWLARRLGLDIATTGPPPLPAHWLEVLAQDLETHRGAALVIAGEQQPPVVHALAQAINAQLGNLGSSVVLTDPIEIGQGIRPLAELVTAMQAGEVATLLILDSNPVYTAPADLAFSEALRQVPFSVHLGRYADETAAACGWHIPLLHELEAWGDVRAYDGTVTIQQPLIAPFYQGKSIHELVAALNGDDNASGYTLIRNYWQTQYALLTSPPDKGGPGGVLDFNRHWERALHDGLIPDTTAPPRPVSLRADFVAALPPPDTADPAALELQFRPDPAVWDGRYANNAWLQELPRPLTKLVWDNAALISPGTAARYDLSDNDLIELHHDGRLITLPVLRLPGMPENAVTVTLGYGRNVGFNVYPLRTRKHPGFIPQVELVRTGLIHPLVTTQQHHRMHGRDLIREATLAEYRENPNFASEHSEDHPTLYPHYVYDSYAWGMAIDLNACIGCNACIIACQAENNIAVVGKEEVARGHDMHWLRVDRYYQGDTAQPEAVFQPVPCMHCEKAPCEYVCPVAATLHDGEGLNLMVYNRCVGTRYCSQNCPYKVRRFNWFQYTEPETPVTPPVYNPDVTVRSRGVMEKCSYCIQRISRARIAAKKDNRRIAEGEVKTACQEVCPTQAIMFGDLNLEGSTVNQWKADPRNYILLKELNTRPRTSYLARLRNPHPALADEQDEEGSG